MPLGAWQVGCVCIPQPCGLARERAPCAPHAATQDNRERQHTACNAPWPCMHIVHHEQLGPSHLARAFGPIKASQPGSAGAASLLSKPPHVPHSQRQPVPPPPPPHPPQTALVVAGSVAGGAALLWPLGIWLEVRKCERPKYSVLRTLARWVRATRQPARVCMLHAAHVPPWIGESATLPSFTRRTLPTGLVHTTASHPPHTRACSTPAARRRLGLGLGQSAELRRYAPMLIAEVEVEGTMRVGSGFIRV